MTIKKIRYGVIGLGRIGWSFHCAKIADSKYAKLVAVADPVEERLHEAEKTYKCKPYNDYKKMLDHGDIDAVVIASPTHMHKEMSLEAFRHSLHVLLEKPMAINVNEARSILRASKRAKRLLTVYQPHRLRPGFQQIQAIISSGIIGRIYHVRRGMFGCMRRNDWQSLKKFGGGMLNNYGAHILDQLLCLTGHDIKNLFSSLRRVAALGDCEDVVKVLYETKSGIIGEMDVNQALADKPYEFEIYGTCGIIRLIDGVLHVRYFSPEDLPSKKLNVSLAASNRKYPAEEIPFKEKKIPVDIKYGVDLYKDFAKAISSGSSPYVPPEETIKVMQIIELCRETAGKIRQTPW